MKHLLEMSHAEVLGNLDEAVATGRDIHPSAEIYVNGDLRVVLSALQVDRDQILRGIHLLSAAINPFDAVEVIIIHTDAYVATSESMEDLKKRAASGLASQFDQGADSVSECIVSSMIAKDGSEYFANTPYLRNNDMVVKDKTTYGDNSEESFGGVVMSHMRTAIVTNLQTHGPEMDVISMGHSMGLDAAEMATRALSAASAAILSDCATLLFPLNDDERALMLSSFRDLHDIPHCDLGSEGGPIVVGLSEDDIKDAP